MIVQFTLKKNTLNDKAFNELVLMLAKDFNSRDLLIMEYPEPPKSPEYIDVKDEHTFILADNFRFKNLESVFDKFAEEIDEYQTDDCEFNVYCTIENHDTSYVGGYRQVIIRGPDNKRQIKYSYIRY